MTWKTPGKTLDLKVGELRIAVGADGGVTFVQKEPSKLLCVDVTTLLYIAQEYQEHNGGTLTAKINPSDWRGWIGST